MLKDVGCRMKDEGSIKAALNSHLGAQAIQCDERDAPQCFLCQPTSRNNSAREGSTAGALASKLNLRSISLADLMERTHNPSFSGGSTQDGIEESRHGSQVYTSIQILARDVKRFTPALCEQVEG